MRPCNVTSSSAVRSGDAFKDDGKRGNKGVDDAERLGMTVPLFSSFFVDGAARAVICLDIQLGGTI